MNLVANTKPVTFEQYMTGIFDCPWSDCRWVEGELVPVPPEYGQNNEIAQYLFFQFKLHITTAGLGYGVCIKDTDIEVESEKHQTRKPDVMVLSTETRELLRNRSAVITQKMAPPLLIVEVISKNYRSVDTVEKNQEYLDRQVPEYWTVDWDCTKPHIIVRTLDKTLNTYTQKRYEVGDMVVSGILPTLNLTVDRILAAA